MKKSVKNNSIFSQFQNLFVSKQLLSLKLLPDTDVLIEQFQKANLHFFEVTNAGLVYDLYSLGTICF